MKVSFHRLARTELIATAQYLESEAGLGAEFLDAFAEWAQKVRRFPESCPLIGHNIRKGIIERFHSVIAYEARSGEIRILYVRHAKQATPDWTARQ